MSFVAGGELSGGIKYAVGEMSDTRPGSKHLTKLQTNVRLSHEPHSFCTFLLKDAELARLLVHNRQKLLYLNVAILTSRLI